MWNLVFGDEILELYGSINEISSIFWSSHSSYLWIDLFPLIHTQVLFNILRQACYSSIMTRFIIILLDIRILFVCCDPHFSFHEWSLHCNLIPFLLSSPFRIKLSVIEWNVPSNYLCYNVIVMEKISKTLHSKLIGP